MCVVIDKCQAANRQLNTAITLYFSGGDIVSVHTLAGAAHNIVHDLIEYKYPSKSWESTIAHDNDLKLAKFLHIARKVQNFIKHAKNDSTGKLSINSDDTEHLLFLVIQNLYILLEHNEILSNEASTFELWFMATHEYTFNEECLNEEFENIKNITKKEQIEYGNQLLLELQKNA